MSLPIAGAILASKAGGKGGQTILEAGKEVLTGDLVKIEGEVFREVTIKVGRKKETRLVPIKYEARINALSMAIAAGGVGLLAFLVGFGLWWSQLRIARIPNDRREFLNGSINGLRSTLVWLDRAIQSLQKGEAIDPNALGPVISLAILDDADLGLPFVPRIANIRDFTLENLIPFRTHILKMLKKQQRRLALGLRLEQRQGFALNLGPEQVSLFG